MANNTHRMLVVDPDRRHLNWLGKIARTVVGQVTQSESFVEPSSEHSYDIVVANFDAMTPGERQMMRRWADQRVPVLLFAAGGTYDGLIQLCEKRDTHHLLARNEQVDPAELRVTVQKLLRRDIFGVEKYYGWGVDSISLAIFDSSEREHVMAEGERFARAIGFPDRFVDQFSSVIDEFVSNALYNAPVDANGRKRFARFSRRERVRLSPHEPVYVTFCCDGRLLGVSTTDVFGSLRSEELITYLAKCFRKGPDQVDSKAGGAGLGFYFVLNCLSQLIVNIEPQRRTELIGLMDVTGTYRDFASQQKSFHIFEAGSPQDSHEPA